MPRTVPMPERNKTFSIGRPFWHSVSTSGPAIGEVLVVPPPMFPNRLTLASRQAETLGASAAEAAVGRAALQAKGGGCPSGVIF
jgi:hypothetical protein